MRAAARRVSLVTLLTLTVVAASCSRDTTITTPPVPPVVHVVDAKLTLEGTHQAILGFAAHNAGGATDTLVAAACPCASSADIVGSASIDPEGTGLFGPNGPHVELHGLRGNVHAGGFVDVTLTFAQAGDVDTEAQVVARS
jgi:copper(I)-binding protein